MIPLPQATRDAKEACGRAIHQNREPYWENTNELSIKTISLPPQKKKKKTGTFSTGIAGKPN